MPQLPPLLVPLQPETGEARTAAVVPRQRQYPVLHSSLAVAVASAPAVAQAVAAAVERHVASSRLIIVAVGVSKVVAPPPVIVIAVAVLPVVRVHAVIAADDGRFSRLGNTKRVGC